MSSKSNLRLSIFTGLWAIVFAAASDAQPPAGGPAANAPRPLIPNAQPVRSCESLTDVSLPNTTIEAAEVDGNACRITAITTHPPAGDRVTIWLAIPMSGWNGRFLGNGGGGFSGGSAGAVSCARIRKLLAIGVEATPTKPKTSFAVMTSSVDTGIR